MEKHVLSALFISDSYNSSDESDGHLHSPCKPSPVFILTRKKIQIGISIKRCSKKAKGVTNEENEIFLVDCADMDDKCAARCVTLSNNEIQSGDGLVFFLDNFKCLPTRSEVPPSVEA